MLNTTNPVDATSQQQQQQTPALSPSLYLPLTLRLRATILSADTSLEHTDGRLRCVSPYRGLRNIPTEIPARLPARPPDDCHSGRTCGGRWLTSHCAYPNGMLSLSSGLCPPSPPQGNLHRLPGFVCDLSEQEPAVLTRPVHHVEKDAMRPDATPLPPMRTLRVCVRIL